MSLINDWNSSGNLAKVFETLAGAQGQLASIYESKQEWLTAAGLRMDAGNDYVSATSFTDNKSEIKQDYLDAASQYGTTGGARTAQQDYISAGDSTDAANAQSDGINAENDAKNY